MENITIEEHFKLPSEAKFYGPNVKPEFSLRSMTINEEMKRLSHSDSPYRTLCEIMDDCMVDKPGISCYDMCIGDYQYVLHKLRIVTYGDIYKTTEICPYCGAIEEKQISLDSLAVQTYTDDLQEYLHVTLPRCKKQIVLNVQTPRMLDIVVAKQKALKAKSPQALDLSMIYSIECLIKSIDGIEPNGLDLENFVRGLSMQDANIILKYSEKINSKVGLNTTIVNTCSQCGADYSSSFRITAEFFRPSVD